MIHNSMQVSICLPCPQKMFVLAYADMCTVSLGTPSPGAYDLDNGMIPKAALFAFVLQGAEKGQASQRGEHGGKQGGEGSVLDLTAGDQQAAQLATAEAAMRQP